MKTQDGKNIILDSDVTVSDLGNSLSEILQQQKEDLDKLKSNVKWLYKYGGVGSGKGGNNSGGSGGDTSVSADWEGFITVNGIPYAFKAGTGEVYNGQIVLPESGSYVVSVRIPKPQGNDFTATFNFGGQITNYKFDLTRSNSWTNSQYLYFNEQKTLTAVIVDGYGNSVVYNFECVTSPYKFSLSLCDNDGNEIIDSDVFINSVKENGLKAKLTYDMFIDFNHISVNTKYIVNSDIVGEEFIINDRSGVKLLNLTNIDGFLEDPDNSGSYTFELTIGINTNSGEQPDQKKSVSFDLIPDELYLKILPDDGIIYKTSQLNNNQLIPNTYIYKAGTKSFSLIPYNGRFNQGNNITISVSLNDNESLSYGPMSVQERRLLSGITLNVQGDEDKVVEYVVKFHAYVGGITKTFEYYLYCENFNNNLNWYLPNKQPNVANYWKGIVSDTFTVTDATALQMTNQSNTLYYNFNSITNPQDILFSAGIQYSEINDKTKPIISICNPTIGNNESYINIFYDKITVGSAVDTPSNERECYLNKTEYENYKIDSSDYHLIQIYKRLLKNEGFNRYYEIVIYIDGVIEASFPNWSDLTFSYTQIILHPANYFLNLLELSYFNNSLSDANLIRYYYTYKINKLGITDTISENDIEMLNQFETGVNFSIEENIPVLTDGTLQTIVKYSDVPVLCLTYQETEDGEFLQWFEKSYGQETTDIPTQNVKVQYAANKELKTIEAENCQFVIDIQGSTTRGYRTKNIELSVVGTDSSESGYYVYTPNFSSLDNNTFLPERSFTLKADVVDSSHSNNNSIGEFINENTDRFSDAISNTGKYGSYIKNCLQGFPVLVFVSLVREGRSPLVYYLGIYNFNLGRNSYFNLGYCDNSKLPELLDGFNIYHVSDLNRIDTFMCAEVANNNPYFDFSQYDSSIVTEAIGSEPAMFGDIVKGANTNDDTLINLVEKVGRAGHFIFKHIGKNFGTNEEGYSSAFEDDGSSKNKVPDFTKQYVRYLDVDSRIKYTLKPNVNPGTEEDLNECINPFYRGLNNIDYQSLVEYYTICMAFGLVDSVQKNLNIKTWNGTRFYTAFYDMDTCLGVNNIGKNTDYFAFSDYWKSAYVDVTEQYPEYSNRDAKVFRPDGIIVYRDFKPDPVDGFDIPSTYLFAIAKYAYVLKKALILSEEDESWRTDMIFPLRLWAKWRKKGGVLQNAQTFIDKYYKHHLNHVNEIMLNYNYRSKYFITNDNTYGVDFDKFKGRRLEYVRQWLDGRFHLLDAYFNVPNAINPITRLTEDRNYEKVIYDGVELIEPTLNEYPSDNPNDNPDVYVANHIFGNNPVALNGKINTVIRALDNSPLFILGNDGSVKVFFLEDSINYYNIYADTNGLNQYTFGGSSSWLELSDINWINKTLTINSDKLTNLVGSSGSIDTWVINLPSIETIKLTSSKYSGNLNIPEVAPNLTDIDISGTKIQLAVDNKPSLKNIKAYGCDSASLRVVNCSNLEKIDLSGGSFGAINIDNVPHSINWNGIKATSIELSTIKESLDCTINSNSSCTGINLTKFDTVDIQNCSKLNTLEVYNAKKVKVSGCPNLTKIVIGGEGNNTSSIIINGVTSMQEFTFDTPDLEELNLANCKNLTTVNLPDGEKIKTLDLSYTAVTKIIYNNNTTNKGYLDLERMPLTNFNIQYNSAVEYIQFANDQENGIPIKNTFAGCTNLTRIYGNVIIKCASCFSEIGKFSIHGNLTTPFNKKSKTDSSGRVIPIYELIGDTENKESFDFGAIFQEGQKVTNMSIDSSSLLSAFYKTACNLFDAYYVLYNVNNQTLALNSAFGGCTNITFNWTNYPNRYMFRKCGNVTNVSFLFYYIENLGPVKLVSPIINEDGTFEDIGIYTPLVHCENFLYTWNSHIYHDRNLFKLEKGNFKVKTLNTLWSDTIVDNINEVTSEPLFDYNNEEHLKLFGNLDGFFDNLKNLETLSNCFKTNSNLKLYINYDTLKIPNNITTITESFHTQQSSGNLDFNKIFNEGSSLKIIENSFKNNNLNNAASFILSNNTFDHTENIESINGGSDNTYKNGFGYNNEVTSEQIRSFGAFSSMLSFTGFKKSFENNIFPYKIIENLSNLKTFTGLFNGIEYENVLQLPGEMFKNHSKLTSVRGAFCDLYAPIELTSGSFNGTNITDASFLFAKTDYKNYSGKYYLNIPYKFFYNGETNILKTIYGCYEEDLKSDLELSTPIYPSLDELQTNSQYKIVISYPNFTKKITNLDYCFARNNIQTYEKEIEDLETERENNPDYNPFDYVYVEKWINNSASKNTCKWQYYWKYNGIQDMSEYNSSGDYDIPKEMIVSRIANCYNKDNVGNFIGTDQIEFPSFFCPPDLFRYCQESCSVIGVFYACGIPEELNSTRDFPKLKTWGIQGRLCPYLLKPLSQITDLSFFLSNCQPTAYYLNEEEEDMVSYIIPQSFFTYVPKLTTLMALFQRLVFTEDCKMNEIFSELPGNLDITRIFFKATFPTQVSEVFNKNSIINSNQAFAAQSTINATNASSSASNQTVRFNTCFKDYSKLGTDKRYQYTFNGYLRNKVTHEDPKTLPDNNETHNYTTI